MAGRASRPWTGPPRLRRGADGTAVPEGGVAADPGGRHLSGPAAHQPPRAQLRGRLRHVYWLGGGSGAGKSTVARRLAVEGGVQVYATDDVMPQHTAHLAPGEAPYLARFTDMDMDERWAQRSPREMLDSFHWFRGEGFHLVVEDLLRLPPEPPIVAEGFRLLPHLVTGLLADPAHAVWLLPTPAFRRAAFDSRGTAWEIPGRTSDPERAMHNLLERDRMFTEWLAEETERLGLPALHVEVGMSEDELTSAVRELFGL